MCLILFALGQHPDYPLLLAANRDEYHGRPARPLAPWPEDAAVAGGRDLEAGGSWLGLSRRGRFAAVTNVREWPPQSGWPRSRGDLVREFLLGDRPAPDFAASCLAHGDDYAGFNLLLGDASGFWYCSNRRGSPLRQLQPGCYGLANGVLGDEWPKTRSGVAALQQLLAEPTPDGLLELLADRTPAADAELPDTGIGLEMERRLAPRFIVGDDYGTRASTALMVTADGAATLLEQNFSAGGRADGRYRIDWRLDALPL
jgi:uncharacterized protein with NRDE domain